MEVLIYQILLLAVGTYMVWDMYRTNKYIKSQKTIPLEVDIELDAYECLYEEASDIPSLINLGLEMCGKIRDRRYNVTLAALQRAVGIVCRINKKIDAIIEGSHIPKPQYPIHHFNN